jgi:hypothetical protein
MTAPDTVEVRLSRILILAIAGLIALSMSAGGSK